MSDSEPIPAQPAGWPYGPRAAGELGRRLEQVAIPGLGSGWTLELRGPLPLDGPASGMPSSFGRGGIRRFGEVVVRPYRRGGLVRHLNEGVYASPARFLQEFEVHQALWQAGFPTVEPLGCGFRKRLWGVEGVFLTRYAEAVAWPTCWERSQEVVPQVVQLVEALAAWGLHAPDLNATNLLVDRDSRVLALDWDRSHWSRATNLRVRYQERLLRSLRKLGAPEAVIDAVQGAFSQSAR
jgi:hypothetical protein